MPLKLIAGDRDNLDRAAVRTMPTASQDTAGSGCRQWAVNAIAGAADAEDVAKLLGSWRAGSHHA
jgi:hypothetical protein